MEKEMNDIFRRFQSRIGLHPYNEINPRIETKETDKSYEVTIEMPGLNKEDINVKIIDNQINIIGKRKQAMEESKGEAILSEFFYGEYRRIISLEKEVEPNSLKFSYTSGLVTIKLNKKKD